MKSFAVTIVAGLIAQAEAFWGTAHLLGKSHLLLKANEDVFVYISCQTSSVPARIEQSRSPHCCP